MQAALAAGVKPGPEFNDETMAKPATLDGVFSRLVFI
jgi:hypothetical protein